MKLTVPLQAYSTWTMSEPDYQAVASAINSAEQICITTHINPDGDGIGSGLALLLALRAAGKRVRFICPSPLASMYNFLPHFNEIEICETEEAAVALGAVGTLISCDCGDLARLGAVAAVTRDCLINLDHHASNDCFGDINLVDIKAESTGVVVEAVLRELGFGLNQPIATCLYTTIVFDTGRFMHSNTTAHTFRWTAALLDTGIDAALINRKLTYTRTAHDLAVQRLALDHLHVDEQDDRIAGIALKNADIQAVGRPEDWGELVEIPRSLIGNEIAFLLRENEDGQSVRCSLRSNPPYCVGPVAEHFGGGGHLQAAGCTIDGSLDSVLERLQAKLRQQMDIS